MIYELRDELRDEKLGSPRYISSIMRRFDHRAGKEEFYTIVTGDMVRDFCLFSVLFAESGRFHGLNWIGDSRHDKNRYHDYIKNETETRRKLNDFLEFMNESNTCIVRYENEDKKPERLSDFFENSNESKQYSVNELFEKLKTHGQRTS